MYMYDFDKLATASPLCDPEEVNKMIDRLPMYMFDLDELATASPYVIRKKLTNDGRATHVHVRHQRTGDYIPL